MKKPFDYLLLLLPCILWYLFAREPGGAPAATDQLVAAILYAAFGAGALLMDRKVLGMLGIVGAVALIGTTQIEHDMPPHDFKVILGEYEVAPGEAADAQISQLLQNSQADVLSIRMPVGAETQMPAGYPYTYSSCDAGDSNRVIYSRFPLRGVTEHAWKGQRQFTAHVQLPARSVSLLLLEPQAEGPATGLMEQAREWVASCPGPVLVAGNFGRTSPRDLGRFCYQSGLSPGDSACLAPQQNWPFGGTQQADGSGRQIFHSKEVNCAGLEWKIADNGLVSGVEGAYFGEKGS